MTPAASRSATTTAAASGISVYNMYSGDSPTMLPRTPIAPETLLAAGAAAAAQAHAAHAVPSPSPLLAANRASPLGGASSTFSSSHRDADAESRHSTENGSSNGDIAAAAASRSGAGSSTGTGVDASAVLAAREKSLISRAMDTVARTVAADDDSVEGDSANGGSSRLGGVGAPAEEAESFEVEGKLVSDGITRFRLASPTPMPSYLNVHFICETASRLLFLSVHWVRSIPAFSMLRYRGKD